MATVEMAITRWFSESYQLVSPEKMDQIRDIFSKHQDDGYLKAYYVFAFGESKMREYSVRDIQCPALVVTGQDDVGSLPEMSEALARDLDNATIIINPGHKHGAPYEFADMMASQVRNFLDQNLHFPRLQ